jgi:hypothetical protein
MQCYRHPHLGDGKNTHKLPMAQLIQSSSALWAGIRALAEMEENHSPCRGGKAVCALFELREPSLAVDIAISLNAV